MPHFTKVLVSDAMLPKYYAKHGTYHLIQSSDTDDQNILKSDWTKSKAGQIQRKVVVTDTSFFFKKNYQISIQKKTNILIDTFPKKWWSRILDLQSDCIRQSWLHPTNTSSLKSYYTLITISRLKGWGMNWFLLEILMLTESCNLIARDETWQHTTKSGTPRSFFLLMVLPL